MSNQCQVLIIGSASVLLTALRSALEHEIDDVGTARTCAEACSVWRDAQPQILVVDLDTWGSDGALPALAETFPYGKLILLGASEAVAPPSTAAAFDGYIWRRQPCTVDGLLASVRALLRADCPSGAQPASWRTVSAGPSASPAVHRTPEGSIPEVRHKTAELEAIREISLELSSELDVARLLQLIATRASELMRADECSLYLYDPARDVIVRQVSGGRYALPTGLVRIRGEGLSGMVWELSRAVRVDDYRIWERRAPDSTSTMVMALGVPVVWRGRFLGVISVGARPGTREPFAPEEAELMELLATHAAIALYNAQLYEQANQLRIFNEQIVQHMSEALLLVNADGRITFVNPAGAALLGYATEELVGQPWRRCVVEEDHDHVMATVEIHRQGNSERYRLHVLQRNGNKVPVMVNASPRIDPEGTFLGTIVVVTDISAQMEAESALLHRLAIEELLTETSRMFIDTHPGDLDNVVDRALAKISRAVDADHSYIFQYAPDKIMAIKTHEWCAVDIPSQRDLQAFPTGTYLWWAAELAALRNVTLASPDDLPEEAQAEREQLQASGVQSLLVVPMVYDGTLKGFVAFETVRTQRTWPDADVALLRLFAEIIAGAFSRREAMLQAWEEAQRVQEVMASVPEGVVLVDADGRIVLMNPTAEALLPALSGDPNGEPLKTLGDRPWKEWLTSPPHGLWHEVTIAGPPRRIFLLTARPVRLRAPEQSSWVLVFRDVTDERVVEQRAQLQERLAAMGQLAAGIAHDFNNIVAVIVLYSQMLDALPDLPPIAHRRLKTINEQAQHASKLIQQILDFNRSKAFTPETIDLAAFLREQHKLLRRVMPETIDTRLYCEPGDYTVSADPTGIQEVIMNLAVNARDAMPDGGTLTMSLTGLVVTPHTKPPLPELKPGPWIRLEIADTGFGIEPEALQHLFEPFFTTKAAGQGTGLGLAQVHGIVSQHGGVIDVTSVEANGTTFVIYLPASPDEGADAQGPSDTTELQRGEGQSVLIVEDNPATLASLEATLEMLGYRTTTVRNGSEALAWLDRMSENKPSAETRPRARRAETVDLIMTDLIMPEMGGEALATTLQERGYHIPILVLSGHIQASDYARLRDLQVAGCLRKPVQLAELAEAAFNALHGTQCSGPGTIPR